MSSAEHHCALFISKRSSLRGCCCSFFKSCCADVPLDILLANEPFAHEYKSEWLKYQNAPTFLESNEGPHHLQANALQK